MKAHQIRFASERTVRLTPVGPVQIKNGSLVRLDVSGIGVIVSANSLGGACQPLDIGDTEWLRAIADSRGYIAELLEAAPLVTVRVLGYHAVRRWPTARDIAIDDQAFEDTRRLNRRLGSARDVLEWLARDLQLEDDQSAVVIATGGSDAVSDNAFRLIGAHATVDVRMVDDRLQVHRVTRRRDNDDEKLTLVWGGVSFVDRSRARALSADEKRELRQLAEAENAYLGIWTEYNSLEREAAVSAARDIGWAEYDRRWLRPDGRIEFELVRHHRADALLARIGDATVGMEAGSGIAFDGTVDSPGTGDRAIVGDAVASERDTIILDPSVRELEGVPTRGYLSGAYTLDKVRLERRDRAQLNISVGATFPVRQLALILGDGEPAPVGRHRRHSPMSDRVKEIFGGDPTEAQLRAIDLAINAQDVVVIQGPPGTGKTRVIAAIQARLTEINQQASALAKRVLFTSYQHDAVANVVQAANDGTLPPVKLGRKDGLEDESYLAAWTTDLAERLERRYRNEPINDYLHARRALRDRATAYRLAPSNVQGTVELLRWLTGQLEIVGPEIVLESRKLAKQLKHELGSTSAQRAHMRILELARRLRTTVEGFADDGQLTAGSALQSQEFFDSLNDSQRRKLGDIASGVELAEAPTDVLRAIRDDVIDRVLDSRARMAVVATMPAVEALLQRALDEADRQATALVSPIDLAIEAYRHAVEHQPAAARASVQTHTRALAATCQQSVSKPMRDAQTVPFDTVIIDEAARANPLDVMIPMTLASGRIVLVGDHRQLPQLLDEHLVPRLSSKHDPAVVQIVLNRSLFERLFVKLRDVQRAGGDDRVVTLDRQFRCHPVLGDFISAQFYAPHGEYVANGIADEALFSHGLERYGRAACGWIDVPHRAGPERRQGNSIARPAEAAVIARELAESLQARPDLTFGVITFYKGQETALWRAMVDAGLAVQLKRGFDLNPSLSWLRTERGLPRVRIGTVDAFQGREFDVVYLSATRSHGARSNAARRFGFLVLPNRLCVAMSRQRKLLIAVGDSATFTSDEAVDAVPALAAFYELAGGEHGFRRSA